MRIAFIHECSSYSKWRATDRRGNSGNLSVGITALVKLVYLNLYVETQRGGTILYIPRHQCVCVTNMTQLIGYLAHLLFTEDCLEEYFDDLNFFHVGCFKSTLSKVLGLGIIGGSFLVKVPQILKILKNKSAEGINVFSVLLDLFAISAMVSYSFISGFPFSSWGDGVFLGIQTLAIAVLVMHFSGDTVQATAFLATYLAVLFVANSGLTSVNVLWACQAMNIPIVLVSKLMQAYTNYSNGSTGQLSAVTGFMLFFGSLARIFTSVQETGDVTMILMYICSTAANAVIAAQILYYWNADAKSKDAMKKAK